MNEFILYIINIKLFTTCSDICIIIEIPLEHSINTSQHSIASEIKFPIINKQRIINIFLYNECSILSQWINSSLRYNLSNLMQSRTYINSIAPISILSGFNNPNILLNFIFSFDSSDFIILSNNLLKFFIIFILFFFLTPFI